MTLRQPTRARVRTRSPLINGCYSCYKAAVAGGKTVGPQTSPPGMRFCRLTRPYSASPGQNSSRRRSTSTAHALGLFNETRSGAVLRLHPPSLTRQVRVSASLCDDALETSLVDARNSASVASPNSRPRRANYPRVTTRSSILACPGFESVHANSGDPVTLTVGPLLKLGQPTGKLNASSPSPLTRYLPTYLPVEPLKPSSRPERL